MKTGGRRLGYQVSGTSQKGHRKGEEDDRISMAKVDKSMEF